MKKIIIAGGTGFIGNYLATRFLEAGYTVFLVSRLFSHLQWDVNELSNAFEGAELVLNLAGKSINCRHNLSNREVILSSRIETTTMIGKAINNCKNAPELWINASATGIYKPSEIKPMTEDEMDLGTDFLAEVTKKWEEKFYSFNLLKTRQIALRTSVVLGKNGGALSPLVHLTRFALGGTQASGRQMISWIHIEDYFQIILFAMQNKNLQGVLNCTSPEPVSNKHFMKELCNTMRVPIALPAPEIAIRFGAMLVGTEPELILNSSYIVPKRLDEAGFKFIFQDISSALKNILT